MTLPIWKRQALYIDWYEFLMYSAWKHPEANAANALIVQQSRDLRQLQQAMHSISTYASNWKYQEFPDFYADQMGMLKDLEAMICRSKDSLSYYNYVEKGHLRCACFYEPDDKCCRIEFSLVTDSHVNWYWKKNICSINAVRKSLRCGLHARVNELSKG